MPRRHSLLLDHFNDHLRPSAYLVIVSNIKSTNLARSMTLNAMLVKHRRDRFAVSDLSRRGRSQLFECNQATDGFHTRVDQRFTRQHRSDCVLQRIRACRRTLDAGRVLIVDSAAITNFASCIDHKYLRHPRRLELPSNCLLRILNLWERNAQLFHEPAYIRFRVMQVTMHSDNANSVLGKLLRHFIQTHCVESRYWALGPQHAVNTQLRIRKRNDLTVNRNQLRGLHFASLRLFCLRRQRNKKAQHAC